MAEDLQALERRLLTQPLDAALRATYAAALIAASDLNAAEQQARLLCQLDPGGAAGPLLLARIALLGSDRAGALRHYEDARKRQGFEAIDLMESLANPASPSATPPVTATPRAEPIDAAASAAAAARPGARAFQPVADHTVRFSSIVGMEALKKTVRLKIIEPFLKPGLFDLFRAGSGGGILLYGPPGCGKTMLARAVANECNAAFVSVGVSDVLTMWLGESERKLAAVFDKARLEAPCVLFFDELDALAYARSKAGASAARTVVNEFLAQMDGFGRDNKGVLILAATNMPWDVDDAMKRPGRFARQVFVAPPDADARRQMLAKRLVDVPCEALDLEQLARQTEHFSGADIDGLVELAKESALADALDGTERGLRMADFEQALGSLNPSTLEWLRTVRNVVRYAGSDATYKEVERYLKQTRLL